MAITVIPDLILVNACDATTSWVGLTGEALISTVRQNQGSGCIADWIDATTSPVFKYPIAPVDLTGKHLYAWMQCDGVIDIRVNGGYRLYAESSGGTATWYSGGNDTHGGGWQLQVASLDATPDATTGTFDKTAVTYVGLQFKVLTAAPVVGANKFPNVFFDVLRYGNGLVITSGASDNITMADIFVIDDDSTNKYGVVTKSSGAYIINGGLTFGDTSSSSIDMNLDGEVLLYPDNDLTSTTFNTIKVLGNTTGTSNLSLTDSVIKSNNIAGIVNLSGTNLDTINIVGSLLANMGDCSFEANQTLTRNVFDNCGLISPSTSIFTSNIIKNSARTASYALFMDTTNSISKTVYTDNYWAFGVNPVISGAKYNEYGGTFINNIVDVYNIHATNAVTINAVNGSDLSTKATAGGIIEITQAPGDVTLDIYSITRIAKELWTANLPLDSGLYPNGSLFPS